MQVVAGALTAMCSTGCLLYCLTRPPPPLPEFDEEDEDEDEERPLIEVSDRSLPLAFRTTTLRVYF